MKLEERIRRVQAAYKRITDMEPDISTERLLAMIADDTDENYGDVAMLYFGRNPDIDG